MENILDRFDAREELMQGDTILNQGDMVGAAWVPAVAWVCGHHVARSALCKAACCATCCVPGSATLLPVGGCKVGGHMRVGLSLRATAAQALRPLGCASASLSCCGLQLEKLYVVKIGEIALFRNDERVEDPNFVHEIAGFSYFGETAITQTGKCPYTIRVASESLHLLSLPKR